MTPWLWIPRRLHFTRPCHWRDCWPLSESMLWPIAFETSIHLSVACMTLHLKDNEKRTGVRIKLNVYQVVASNEKDPVGRSSLATYQTHQVPVSFGPTGVNQSDTGQRPGLCTCTLRRTASRDEESGLRILARTSNGGLSQSARRTHTNVVVTVGRLIPVTVGGPYILWLIVERTATQHADLRTSPSGIRL